MALTKIFCLILFSCIAFAVAEPLLSFKVPLSTSTKRLLGYTKESFLNFAEDASSKGYHTEEHTVTTQDGYILTIFRLNDPTCATYQKVPVLLNHAILLNGDSFIAAGVETAPGYLLAKSCYDVWVGTNRGTNYGRNHISLKPDTDAEFWNYGLDEISASDNPAIIDYVAEQTGSEKINYIGHSQGANTILLTLAEKPEYNNKLGVVIALNPTTIIKDMPSAAAKLIFEVCYNFQDLFTIAGIHEFLAKGFFVNTIVEFLCQSGRYVNVCREIIYAISGNNTDSIEVNTLKNFYSKAFVGISVKLGANYQQLIESGLVAKYDYGASQNLIVYGTETPALYDLSKVTAPVVLVGGLGDLVATPQNVIALGKLLPNLVGSVFVDEPTWNHIDSMYSKQVPTLLYPTVNQYLSKYCN